MPSNTGQGGVVRGYACMITRRLGPCRRPVDRYSHSMNLFNSLSIYLRFIYELLGVCSVEFCGASQTKPASFQASCQERNEKLHYHLFPEPQAQSYYDTMPSTHPYIHTYIHTTLFFFFPTRNPENHKVFLTYGSARQCDNRVGCQAPT